MKDFEYLKMKGCASGWYECALCNEMNSSGLGGWTYGKDHCMHCGGPKTLSSTNKSKHLFKKLAREGECWHGVIENNDGLLVCKYCARYAEELYANPNFFDPKNRGWELFGWMWERVKDKNGFNDFLISHPNMYALISCKALAEAIYKYLITNKPL